MIVMTLALELEHCVYDVLQSLRPGDWPFFGDVADEEDGDSAILREQQELARDFPDLRDGAGSRFDVGREDGLNRIYYDRARIHPLYLVKNIFERRFRQQVKPLGFDAQALAAQLDLALGFLARHVENRHPLRAHLIRDLQQQCALAYAGVAADQNQRAGNDAAAEHAVKLRDAGRDARVILRFDLVVGDGLDLAQTKSSARRGGRILLRRDARALFDERIPPAAIRTLPQPLARLIPAILTDINCRRCFRHFSILPVSNESSVMSAEQ